MQTFWLVLYLVFTLAISCFNAYSVGRFWTEKSDLPTSLKLLLWSGAIMAWCGFFYVFLVPTTVIFAEAHIFEFMAMLLKIDLTPESVQFIVEWVFDLALLFLFVPIMGSGLVILVNSWAQAFAEKNFANFAVAGYNTFAMARNTVTFAKYLPEILGKLFGTIFKGKDAAKRVLLVLALAPVAVSAILAFVATATIIKMSDQRYQLADQVK